METQNWRPWDPKKTAFSNFCSQKPQIDSQKVLLNEKKNIFLSWRSVLFSADQDLRSLKNTENFLLQPTISNFG